MNKRKKHKRPGETPESQPADEAQAQSTAPPAEQDASVSPTDADIDWKDRFLRSKAELSNLQRRLVDERNSAVKFANAGFARGLLDVVDDLERTLDAAGQDGSSASVLEGVKLIHTKLLKVLKDNHVRPIDAVGQPFDPNYHEALLQQPSDQPAGTVLQMVQCGYQLHDRVIRPSRVIIAKPTEAVET